MNIIEQIQHLQRMFVEGDRIFTDAKTFIESRNEYESRQQMYWEVLSEQGKLPELLNQMQTFLHQPAFGSQMPGLLDIHFLATDMMLNALIEGKPHFLGTSSQCLSKKNQLLIKEDEETQLCVTVRYEQELHFVQLYYRDRLFLTLDLPTRTLISNEDFFMRWIQEEYNKEKINWVLKMVYSIAKGFETLGYQIELGILTRGDAHETIKKVISKNECLDHLLLALYDGQLGILMEKSPLAYSVVIDDAVLELDFVAAEDRQTFRIRYVSQGRVSFYMVLVEHPTIRDWLLQEY